MPVERTAPGASAATPRPRPVKSWCRFGKGEASRTIAAASFALLAITIPAHADGPLIVIDRWWGIDYAKVDCRIPAFKPAGESEAACDQEKTESYNVF